MPEGKSNNKIIKGNKKDYIILPLIFIGVMVFGLLGLLLMQKFSTNNRYICTYLGRLWMPDKEKNIPGVHKCYTYGEYYSYKE